MKAVERAFQKAHYEIDFIRTKTPQKVGMGLLKYHKYSVKELLTSEHHAKIHSITAKIGDDVENWHKAGKLNHRDLDYYHKERDNLEKQLHQAHLDILNRQPTWLEALFEVFQDVLKIIINNLPILQTFLPEGLATILWFLPSANPLKRLTGK